MSSAAERYQSFDFTQDEKWQGYLRNIYPTPSGDTLEKIKRKWYTKNVDSQFDPTFEEKQKIPSSSQDSQESRSSASQPSEESGSNSAFQSNPQAPTIHFPLLYKFEGYAKIIFFASLILASGALLRFLSASICICAILRSFGSVKFTREYLSQIVKSEFSSNLFFILVMCMPPSQNTLLFFFPLAIHFLCGVAEFLFRENHPILGFTKVKRLMSVIKTLRSLLIIGKCKIEFGLILVLILYCCFGFSSLFQLIVYLQFISLKFKLNVNMQIAHSELRCSLAQPGGLFAAIKPLLLSSLDLFTKAMNYL